MFKLLEIFLLIFLGVYLKILCWWCHHFQSNYFSLIANKIKHSISYSQKHFSAFLKRRSNVSFFLRLTDKTERENVILDSNRSVGTMSFSNKVLKLLKKDIFSPLYNMFFLWCLPFNSGKYNGCLCV